MGCLYKIENHANGKCYYGQTTRSAEGRKKSHFIALINNRAAQIKLTQQPGYKPPALGRKHTDESKAKMSAAISEGFAKGREGPNKGKKFSKTTCEKISKARTEWSAVPENRERQSKIMLEKYENGYVNPHKGVPKTEQQKLAISTARKKILC